jgi:aminopeptidase N
MSELSPIHYSIHLEPDLQTFRFSGKTEIFLFSKTPVKEVSLDVLDLAIWTCRLAGDRKVECPFYFDPGQEELRIHLPESIQGDFTLEIEYMGHINEGMAGLYRTRYQKGKEVRYAAVSQLQESDARRVFPCFDHPGKKATFDLEVILDERLTPLSNGPITEERFLEGGKRLVRFKRTPNMSTYLLFFGAGEFEFISDPEQRVRVVTVPGMTRFASFGLRFGTQSLRYCEEYFAIPYPLPKLDLIGVPDFAAGAMENWGAITFRENLLLHFPQITSKAGEERICEVIAHEIAHQWFGNLVTPADWKYLWLNESFATFFAYGAVDHYFPEWDMWDRFLEVQTDPALKRDALHETFPIEIPGGEHVVINASTAPIIYNKGGSILRQIRGYLGEDPFKEGIRFYLRKNQYGSASSEHLWEAMEEVTGEPVTELMKSWVEQPGHPIVEVSRKDNLLFLAQKRFTYLPNDAEQTWIIPMTLRLFREDGRSEWKTFLLSDKEATLDLGAGCAAYKINDAQTGFYRVHYLTREDLDLLGERVENGELSSRDRGGLQNDLYALAMGGSVTFDEYLDFLSHYRGETSFLPVSSISGNLHHAYLVFGGERRKKIASAANLFLEQVFSEIGFSPKPQEKKALSVLRDQILFDAVLFGSKDVETFALDQFSSLSKGGNVHPDIARSILQVAAWKGGSEVFDWLCKRMNTSPSEHERMNILSALGCFSDPHLIERSQAFLLDSVPNRNKFIPVVSMAANPAALPTLWDWYISHLEALERFHPAHYERIVAAIVPFSGLGREDEVKSFFQEYQKKDRAKDVISLSLERLRIHSGMKERWEV